MHPQARADKIRKVLRDIFPEVKTQLFHQNAFQLLVATILSAQCTDKQVNQVTPVLFKNLKTPADFAAASLKAIEKWIRPTGFFHNKAKNIKSCARAILDQHDGQVPRTLEELVKLPGVGRKTANVVLGAAFGIPGVVVDTHVGRISKRLGLSENKNPVKIEYDLMEIIPRHDWNDFCLRLIFFGRSICIARKPKCLKCPLNKLCPWPHKTT
ncbi:MAG: endonuclease III [Deltaproteobacteria bacterium]|jgi:endonuclease-3|nr:endonuclease III [Deltaproteobacteria bacterium]